MRYTNTKLLSKSVFFFVISTNNDKKRRLNTIKVELSKVMLQVLRIFIYYV